jgi:hypothetical protein
VKFEFFHAVEELGTGRDELGNRVIDSITIGVQATVKGGGAYKPLYPVKGLPCWPSTPLYDQLDQGAELERSGENLENWWNRWPNVATRVLRRGVDFDDVVLGISIGAYPYVCKKLIDETPAFARMVTEVQVTQTQGAQIWLRPDYEIIGWPCGPRPVIGTYKEPFDTLSDMSHLIPRESWPPATVGNITYLCSQLPDHGPPATPPRSDWQYPFQQQERVTANVNQWFDLHVGGLWPYALDTNSGSLNWDMLVGEGVGRDRLKSQYWVGCWNPSDRYVMSVPGSVHSRLCSAQTGYHNLVMSGDWTLTAISSGCVEAAVMSGMHASRAMCGVPAKIVGDDLPDGGDLPPVPPTPPRPPPASDLRSTAQPRRAHGVPPPRSLPVVRLRDDGPDGAARAARLAQREGLRLLGPRDRRPPRRHRLPRPPPRLLHSLSLGRRLPPSTSRPRSLRLRQGRR